MVYIRPNSKTFSKWTSYKLDAKCNETLFVPRGSAYSFYAYQDETVVSYKVDNYYNKEAEASIIWNDRTLNIDWRNDTPIS